MTKRYVIAYDIPKTRRRTKLHDLLQGYGERVNHSVFELTLSDSKMELLRFQIEQLIKPKEDSVRIYPVCLACAKAAYALGNEAVPFETQSAML